MQVQRQITLDVPADEVWSALTEAERLAEWFANDVEFDAREGGRAAFRWDNGEERTAVVEEVDPGRHLTLRWEDDGGLVTLELEPVPDGTTLRVVESSPEFATALEVQALAWATA
jgi:uncharacterized protein YndB with AHSA1/START domain